MIRIMKALHLVGILIITVLFGLDIATTSMVLSLGGAELNAFMAGVVVNPARHLLVKGSALLVIILMTQFAESRIRGSGFYLIAAVIGLYTFVLANNIAVLMRCFQ
jgi:hypothetical protein